MNNQLPLAKAGIIKASTGTMPEASFKQNLAPLITMKRCRLHVNVRYLKEVTLSAVTQF